MYKLLIIFTITVTLNGIHSGVITSTITKDELSKYQDKFLKECMTEHGISDEEMQDFLNLEKPKPSSHHLKCMLACFGERMGFINGTTIDWDLLHLDRKISNGEELYKSKMSQVVENCRKTVKDGEEKCELSYQLGVCLKEGVKKQI